MNLPKFIITMDGTFRLGMVDQHKHLLKPGDQCIGGGYYHFDFVSNRIIFDRESYDFGRPKWHLIDVLKVPSTYRGMRIVYKYDDGFHDDFKAAIKSERIAKLASTFPSVSRLGDQPIWRLSGRRIRSLR
jgi:hypothetical protein